MQLTQKDQSIIRDILKNLDCQVIVFGSRVKGNARSDSDLDLCLKNAQGEVALTLMSSLREAFENSDLPFSVDLVDYSHLADTFRQAVDEEGVDFI